MLNLNFVNKAPKIAKDNEIILLTQKVKKNKEVKDLTKSVFSIEKTDFVKSLTSLFFLTF